MSRKNHPSFFEFSQIHIYSLNGDKISPCWNLSGEFAIASLCEEIIYIKHIIFLIIYLLNCSRGIDFQKTEWLLEDRFMSRDYRNAYFICLYITFWDFFLCYFMLHGINYFCFFLCYFMLNGINYFCFFLCYFMLHGINYFCFLSVLFYVTWHKLFLLFFCVILCYMA